MPDSTPDPGYENISAAAAAPLIESGAVRILDVRNPDEYTSLGHIPGAILLPVNLIPVALATLSDHDKPLLVCCEHGIRSASAADFLSRAGVRGVMNLLGGMSVWTGPREHTVGTPFGSHGPCSWIIQNADLLPPGGTVLDVACGRGRHALLFAAAGFDVRAVDNDAEKIAMLTKTAKAASIALRAEVLDLETDDVNLGESLFDVILGVHYLHRPLFPLLVNALRPGGLLLYETFTVDQKKHHGKPSNPDFLLEHGELEGLVAPLDVLRQRDGEFEGRFVASVAARKSVESLV